MDKLKSCNCLYRGGDDVDKGGMSQWGYDKWQRNLGQSSASLGQNIGIERHLSCKEVQRVFEGMTFVHLFVLHRCTYSPAFAFFVPMDDCVGYIDKVMITSEMFPPETCNWGEPKLKAADTH